MKIYRKGVRHQKTFDHCKMKKTTEYVKPFTEKDKTIILQARELILQHPGWHIKEFAKILKCSLRSISYARAQLIEEGRIPPSRNSPRDLRRKLPRPGEVTQPLKIDVVQSKELFDMIKVDTSPLLNVMEQSSDPFDDEMRQKMLREVKLIAFDPATHPDTRLSAIATWAKLRDLERAKDLGPGLPMTEKQVLDRLSRLMLGVGVPIVLKALEIAFPKEKINETEQVATLSGASETLSPA